jgi:hypothetical protein
MKMFREAEKTVKIARKETALKECIWTRAWPGAGRITVNKDLAVALFFFLHHQCFKTVSASVCTMKQIPGQDMTRDQIRMAKETELFNSQR